MKCDADIIAEVKANNRALLYRCRWCADDASRIVPELVKVLSNRDPDIVDEALRSLFTIGTPAVAAAASVSQLISSERPITRQLATLTLGQIAHKDPSFCIGPITGALVHKECLHDALRILSFIGSAAKGALPQVVPFCESADARTRKLAILAAMSIAGESELAQRIASKARTDPSKIVRLAVEKAMRNSQPNAGDNRALPQTP
jgi:hypothetical protein